MPVKISQDYIDESLKSLYSLLGIHENLSSKKIYYWISKKEINEANKVISEHIGIPNPVYVEFIKGERLISSALTERENPSFITAQIEIPSNLPIYGDPALKDIPIRIKLNNELKYKSKEVISCVLAHENTHLILDLLRYQRRYKEIDTDLASIVLGLGDLINKGRAHTDIRYNLFYTEYRTETFGYLDDESFNYAYRKTRNLYNSYNKHKLDILKRIKNVIRLVEKSGKVYSRFKENFDWIVQNLNSIKFKSSDSPKFVEMQNFIFQKINFIDILMQKNKILNNLFKTANNRKIYYPSEEYEFIKKINIVLNNKFKETKADSDNLKEWLRIQMKYLKFTLKISTALILIKN